MQPFLISSCGEQNVTVRPTHSKHFVSGASVEVILCAHLYESSFAGDPVSYEANTTRAGANAGSGGVTLGLAMAVSVLLQHQSSACHQSGSCLDSTVCGL